MTNGELVNRHEALQRAADHVQSVRARYAVQKTLREFESSLETYRETLAEVAQEHDVDLSQGIPEDAPEAFREDLEELLQMETDEPDVHTIDVGVLGTEDEKGSDIPLGVIADLDFMIDE